MLEYTDKRIRNEQDVARYLNLLASMPDVRQELVDRVRAEIETGNYETPEKIEAAIDELAEDLV